MMQRLSQSAELDGKLALNYLNSGEIIVCTAKAKSPLKPLVLLGVVDVIYVFAMGPLFLITRASPVVVVPSMFLYFVILGLLCLFLTRFLDAKGAFFVLTNKRIFKVARSWRRNFDIQVTGVAAVESLTKVQNKGKFFKIEYRDKGTIKAILVEPQPEDSIKLAALPCADS